MAKPALGRGLGALLGGPIHKATPLEPAAVAASGTEAALPAPGERVQQASLDRIRHSPFQPRKDFPAESLQELADSIKQQGVIQPLVVREKDNHFELIAGERRWRAAQLAGLREVPIIVRNVDDKAVLEMALIENLQRENLNPIEEALGYAQLTEQFQLRQEDVATRVGKSRAAVANALRLLKLPADLQSYLRSSRLSLGHAKVILGLDRAEHQTLAAERVLRDGLSVRATEELVARLQPSSAQATGKAGGATAAPRDVNITSLEDRLRERFGTKVQLRYRQGKGSLEIKYYSDDELERILELVGVSHD
jgi:ParB family chromosome partitioning protein